MERSRDPDPPVPPPGQDDLPYDDGEPMESVRHRVQMNVLIETLEAWPERPQLFVGGNMFVYFSELQTRGQYFRGPDVFVVLDAEPRADRKSWVAWEESSRLPDVVIELLSKSTEGVDRGDKMRVYARLWKTQTYVLHDPIDHRLEAYERDPISGEYRALLPDARGDFPVARLALSLGLRPGGAGGEPGPFLRWIDRSGDPLPTDRERAERERERADAALARVAELEAELARRG